MIDEITELNSKLDQAIEFSKLDLGYTYADEDIGGPVCSDSSNYRTKKRYPTAYISRVSEDPKDFPEKGKAVIEYVVTEKRTRSSSKAGSTKSRHSMDIEIHSIDPIKKGDDKSKSSDTVSKLKGSAEPISELSALRPGMIEFNDPRARNPQGQFADVSTGGANPMAMKKAYGKPGTAIVGGQMGMGKPLLPKKKKIPQPGIQAVTKAFPQVG